MQKNTFYTIKLSLILSLLFLISCSQKPSSTDFQIKGKLNNGNNKLITLVDLNARTPKVIDSVQTDKNGEFLFTQKVPTKGFYNIEVSASNYATIIADSSNKITFEANADNIGDTYKISGSSDAILLQAFDSLTRVPLHELQTIRNTQDSLQRVYEAFLNTSSKQVALDSLSNVLEPTFNKLSDRYSNVAYNLDGIVKGFIDKYPDSFAILAAVQLLSIEQDIAYYIKVAQTLSEKYPNVQTLKDFTTYINEKKRAAIGMPAPEITMNDIDGKPITLSSLRGKTVIVDFWASWCKPCRAENPFMVNLYNTFHNKGLEMYSVSLDFDKDAWLKAIIQDHLSWKNHVCDFKQWQSPIVALYGFNGIPFTCIVDKNGNIAAKNLRGPQLQAKIEELLAAK